MVVNFLLFLMIVRSFAYRVLVRKPSQVKRLGCPSLTRTHKTAWHMTFQPGYLALDFDGVVCASSGESSVSSIIAANAEWPDVCKIEREGVEFNLFREIVSDVRPIIETGYENMLVVRYITEDYHLTAPNNTEDVEKWKMAITSHILSQWNGAFRDQLLTKYEGSKDALIQSFGHTRDKMIKEELPYWVNLNKVYSTVKTSLKKVSADDVKSVKDLPTLQNLFIITTKQERFVRAILENNDLFLIREGLDNRKDHALQEELSLTDRSNIFDLDNAYGSKIKVLQELTKRLGRNGKEQCSASIDMINKNKEEKTTPSPIIHFVEDRFETLMAVLAHRDAARQQDATSSTSTNIDRDNGNGSDDIDDDARKLAVSDGEHNAEALDNVKLYLVDWGYNTEEQRQLAKKNPDITLITQEEFAVLVSSTL